MRGQPVRPSLVRLGAGGTVAVLLYCTAAVHIRGCDLLLVRCDLVGLLAELVQRAIDRAKNLKAALPPASLEAVAVCGHKENGLPLFADFLPTRIVAGVMAGPASMREVDPH